jgi:hypothetical protein
MFANPLTNILRSFCEVGVHNPKSDLEVLRCYLVAKATLPLNYRKKIVRSFVNTNSGQMFANPLTNILRSFREVGVHNPKSDLEVLRCYLITKVTLPFK